MNSWKLLCGNAGYPVCAADAVCNTVRSDAALSDDSRFSVYHVMLSALIPAEVLMESDPSLW